MRELFEIVGFFTCAAIVSFGLSYVLFRLPIRRLPLGFAPGALARIKTSDGVHRTRFVRRSARELVFAAPLQRDHYVPLSVGDEVMVEAPMRDGVLLFRTKIAARDGETHEVSLAIPERFHREERRGSERRAARGIEITVEERPAWLIDLSEQGARFTRNGPLPKGERIRLDVEDEMIFGWVMECSPNFVDGVGSHIVRARFEQPAHFTLA